MINDEEFRQAFATAERYERYKLVRTTGFTIIIIGIGRFLLSWIIDQTFLYSLNLDAMGLAVFRFAIQIILAITLLLTLVYSYISTKKTSINQGGKIVSVVDIQFGISMCILIYLTFFLRIITSVSFEEVMGIFRWLPIIASVYIEEVIGIFLFYLILRRGIKYDFRELLHLGLISFLISLIEVGGRYILVMDQWNSQIFVPIWTVFHLGIAVIFMIPYLFFGQRIIQSASVILEEN